MCDGDHTLSGTVIGALGVAATFAMPNFFRIMLAATFAQSADAGDDSRVGDSDRRRGPFWPACSLAVALRPEAAEEC
jgi:hypothetical protein